MAWTAPPHRYCCLVPWRGCTSRYDNAAVTVNGASVYGCKPAHACACVQACTHTHIGGAECCDVLWRLACSSDRGRASWRWVAGNRTDTRAHARARPCACICSLTRSLARSRACMHVCMHSCVRARMHVWRFSDWKRVVGRLARRWGGGGGGGGGGGVGASFLFADAGR